MPYFLQLNMNSTLVYKKKKKMFFTFDQTWISKTSNRHQVTAGVYLPFGEYIITFTLSVNESKMGLHVRNLSTDNFSSWSFTYKTLEDCNINFIVSKCICLKSLFFSNYCFLFVFKFGNNFNCYFGKPLLNVNLLPILALSLSPRARL